MTNFLAGYVPSCVEGTPGTCDLSKNDKTKKE